MKDFLEIIKTHSRTCTYVEGYNADEIISFFHTKVFDLPDSYLDFLLIMGKENFFLRGDFYSLKFLPLIKRTSIRKINKFHPDLSLKDNYFPFWANQGSYFAFFDLNEGNNPRIYGFVEGQMSKEFETVADDLSSFCTYFLKNENPFLKIKIDKKHYPELFLGNFR